MTLILIGKVELQEGEGRAVEVEGKTLAIFKKDSRYYALENACPHKGGSLGEGFLSENSVICPLHSWQFDLATGKNLSPGGSDVKTYKIVVKGDELFVET